MGGCFTPSFYLERVEWSREAFHGRPWLPRGGATALGGGATELMGDVIILLVSERWINKKERTRRRNRSEKREQTKR